MDALAMQFAGFMSIAHLVPHWDRECVEDAIRRWRLPRRDAGLTRIMRSYNESLYKDITAYKQSVHLREAAWKNGEHSSDMTKRSTARPTRLWTVLAKCHYALRSVVECSIGGTGLVLSDFVLLEELLHKGPLTIIEIQDKVLLATGS